MIERKKRGGFVAILVVMLVLTGWITFTQTRAEETSYDYEHMVNAVVIQLDEEPKLQSPIRTKVAARDQAYTLHFKEAMDHESVEQAIIHQARLYTDQHRFATPPDFLFDWNGDQELHLTAQVSPYTQRTGEPDRSYVIDVSGARTKSGNELIEAPKFTALLALSKQLWRVSVDGEARESLTALKQPYEIEVLDSSARYLLLSRYTEYCGCDTDYQKLYSVYDTTTQTTTRYSVPLTTMYTGPGNFVADKRGFFYMEPPPSVPVPKNVTAITINVDHHILGAIFSKDRKYVLMIVENEFANDSNDFIIYNVQTGRQQYLGTVVRGEPEKEVAVRMIDDGSSVYFTMQAPDSDKSEFHELGYQFSWTNNTVKPWVSPVKEARGTFLSASSDGMYRVYANGGIYRQLERVGEELTIQNGYWLPGTHLLADLYSDDHLPTNTVATGMKDLLLYNVDQGTYKGLLLNLPDSTRILGASADGKWIYLESDTNLKHVGQ